MFVPRQRLSRRLWTVMSVVHPMQRLMMTAGVVYQESGRLAEGPQPGRSVQVHGCTGTPWRFRAVWLANGMILSSVCLSVCLSVMLYIVCCVRTVDACLILTTLSSVNGSSGSCVTRLSALISLVCLCMCVYVLKLYVVCYDQRDVDMLHTNLSSAENCFWFSENQTVRYFAFHGVGFPSQLPARCGFQCQYTEWKTDAANMF